MDCGSAVVRAGGQGVERDEVTLIRAAQVDPAAFGALHQHYHNQVYWYLRARTSNDDDASDLTQQVFMQALEALPRYRDRGAPFAAWLFRIARNAAINFHRSRRRQRWIIPWSLVPEASMAGPEQEIEAQVLREEALERLHDSVAALNAEKRDLLALRFAAGLTVREIAAVVGKSEAAVKKSLARTMQTLKEQYHDV